MNVVIIWLHYKSNYNAGNQRCAKKSTKGGIQDKIVIFGLNPINRRYENRHCTD